MFMNGVHMNDPEGPTAVTHVDPLADHFYCPTGSGGGGVSPGATGNASFS